jgi:hypothetical protein
MQICAGGGGHCKPGVASSEGAAHWEDRAHVPKNASLGRLPKHRVLNVGQRACARSDDWNTELTAGRHIQAAGSANVGSLALPATPKVHAPVSCVSWASYSALHLRQRCRSHSIEVASLGRNKAGTQSARRSAAGRDSEVRETDVLIVGWSDCQVSRAALRKRPRQPKTSLLDDFVESDWLPPAVKRRARGGPCPTVALAKVGDVGSLLCCRASVSSALALPAFGSALCSCLNSICGKDCRRHSRPPRRMRMPCFSPAPF